MTVEQNDMYKLSLILIPLTWVIGIITSLIFYFALHSDIRWVWVRSYIIGLASGLLCFGIMVRTNKYMPKDGNDKTNFRKITLLSYFMRFLLLAAIFAAIVFTDGLDPIPGLIGYGTLKVVLIVLLLIKKGDVVKE